MPSLSHVYTSEAELVRLMSATSLDQYLMEPDGTALTGITTPTRDDVLYDAIEQATDKVNDYCYQLYAPAKLETSRWVRLRATQIAAHLLTQRKGEPGRYQELYDSALNDLEEVRMIRRYIPRLQTIADHRPTADNQVINDTFLSARARVSRQSSSDSPSYSNMKPDSTYYGNRLEG